MFAPVAAVSFATDKVPGDRDQPEVPAVIAGTCPVDAYKFLNSGPLQLSVPDNDPSGVETPPLRFPYDEKEPLIDSVVVDMDFEHTWVSDLNIQLRYDDDCDPRTPFIGPVSLLCRQRIPGCPESGCPGGCRCDADLTSGGRYVWGIEGALKEMAEPICSPDSIAYGCYSVATESEFGLDVFAGHRQDGCWTLHLQDGAGFDFGILHDWTIHVRNEGPTAVAPASWGAIKAVYRD